ncbi:hypothetical protein [Bradyrhizobium sp. ORS 285]|uniref:hypothetical protein n=1 Tax=Bradyrhizobium sp. ORS 285 TaxID=115808 RepID=UPI000554781A|nr:hypothetical protein [Bradyrhizobium sp. ORS 285]
MMYGCAAYASVEYGGRIGSVRHTSYKPGTPSVVLRSITETIVATTKPGVPVLRTAAARVTLTTSIQRDAVILPSDKGDEPTLL